MSMRYILLKDLTEEEDLGKYVGKTVFDHIWNGPEIWRVGLITKISKDRVFNSTSVVIHWNPSKKFPMDRIYKIEYPKKTWDHSHNQGIRIVID